MLKGGKSCSNPMPLRVFIGGNFNETHEREQAKRILLDLYDLYGNAKEWCAIFLNVEIEQQVDDGRVLKKEIDGLAFKEDKVIILEMKDLSGNIEVDLGNERENTYEKWVVKNDGEKPYTLEDRLELPFRQVNKQRGKVVNLLQQVLSNDKVITREKLIINDIMNFIAGFVVVKDDSIISIKNYDRRKQKWFNIIKEEQVPEYLSIQTCWNIRISQDILERVSRILKVPKYPKRSVRELSPVNKKRIKYWYMDFEGF